MTAVTGLKVTPLLNDSEVLLEWDAVKDCEKYKIVLIAENGIEEVHFTGNNYINMNGFVDVTRCSFKVLYKEV